MNPEYVELGAVFAIAMALIEALKMLIYRMMNGSRSIPGAMGQDEMIRHLYDAHLGAGSIRNDGSRRWWFPDGKLDTLIKLQSDTLGEIQKLRKATEQ